MVPRTVQLPSLGSSTPAMILSIVDLPDPLVPTRPKTSPRRTWNEMPSSARNSLNMSSRRTILMKYSLRLVRRSLAMLNTMETLRASTITSPEAVSVIEGPLVSRTTGLGV